MYFCFVLENIFHSHFKFCNLVVSKTTMIFFVNPNDVGKCFQWAMYKLDQ